MQLKQHHFDTICILFVFGAFVINFVGGMCTNGFAENDNECFFQIKCRAKDAVAAADALIAELNK